MSLKEEINRDLNEALKAREETRRGVLRMLKARILEAEVDLRTQKGRDYQLNDDEVVEVIRRYAKQRHQSIDAFRSANRPDLVAQEEGELEVLKQYLPRQLSQLELESLARQVIEEVGASSMRDLGRVMGPIMSRVKGSADGKVVREMVQKLLS